MNRQNDIKNWYKNSFDKFEDKLNGGKNSFLHSQRLSGLKQFEKQNFPSLKNEEWKYTNVSPILQEEFMPAVITGGEVSDDGIPSENLMDIDSHKLIFINGKYSNELSSIGELPDGVFLGSLKNALISHPEAVEKYFNKIHKQETAFSSLNTTFSDDGLFVYIPKMTVIDKPVQALFLSTEENLLLTPHNLIIAEEGSEASIIQIYSGAEGVKYFNNITSESFVAEGAHLKIFKVQRESKNAFHIERNDAEQKPGSGFYHYSLSFGGSLVRNDLNTLLNGENIECNYHGLYLADDNQHIDNHTFVDHAKPNCLSSELYKGIVDENAHGVFNGKILVRKDAQKTNAFQSNKNVLLSEEATVDTKPQLEIYADDVKCSHGATVGQLDKAAEFYLRSRGIPVNIARTMILLAFANDVIAGVKHEKLKIELSKLIYNHLHKK